MVSVKITRFVLIALILYFLFFCFFQLSSILGRFSTPVKNEFIRYQFPDQLPGAYIEKEYQRLTATNSSYCDFNYGLPRELTYSLIDLNYSPELGRSGHYKVLYNMIEANMNDQVPSVTYATHVSADYLVYLPELIRYWDGYISLTAFVPDRDIVLVLEQLTQYCYCLPGMSRVSVHLVYFKNLPPSLNNFYFIEPTTCKVPDTSQMVTYRSFNDTVAYPINVCRNVARTAAFTDHVLVSDIHLMPSEGLAGKFVKMTDNGQLRANFEKQVYVLPIFEVEESEDIPRTKKQLLELFFKQKAVYFHKKTCSHCQKFPGIQTWLNSDNAVEIQPLLTAKREVPYHRWEPIYIGTKDEPYYNEALSWEGLQDKMLQTLEMCLMGYKFVILDGAFLVHWPGIKKTKTNEGEKWRQRFIKKNEFEYSKILLNLTAKYPSKPQCRSR